jgi:hypothetical protein
VNKRAFEPRLAESLSAKDYIIANQWMAPTAPDRPDGLVGGRLWLPFAPSKLPRKVVPLREHTSV